MQVSICGKRFSLKLLLLCCVLGGVTSFASCQCATWAPLTQCNLNSDCPNQWRCVERVCQAPKGPQGQGKTCQGSSDCELSESCVAGKCRKAPPETSTESVSERSFFSDGGPDASDGGPDLQPQDEPMALDRAGPEPQTERKRPEPDTISRDGAGTDGKVRDGDVGAKPVVKVVSDKRNTNKACNPGTARRCELNKGATQEFCRWGLQQCITAGVWDTCRARSQSQVWGPASKAEACDGKDNNCDGRIDEGCRQKSTACQPLYALPYVPTVETRALLLNSSRKAFARDRGVRLSWDRKTGLLWLEKLVFQGTKATSKRWLLSLPPTYGFGTDPNKPDYLWSYDINPQGSWIALAAKQFMVFVAIGYDANGSPSILRTVRLQSKNIERVSFADNDKIVMAQLETPRFPEVRLRYRFSMWRLDSPSVKDQQFRVSLLGHRNLYAPRGERLQLNRRLSIDRKGKLVGFVSSQRLRIYALPSFRVVVDRSLPSPQVPYTRYLAFHPTKPEISVAIDGFRQIMTFDLSPGKEGQELLYFEGLGEGEMSDFGYEPTTGLLQAASVYKQGERWTVNMLWRWPTPKTGVRVKSTFVGGRGYRFAFHDATGLAAVSHTHNWISLIDTKTNKVLSRLQANLGASRYSNGYALRMHFSSDGKRLFLLHSRVLELWDITKPTTPSRLQNLPGSLSASRDATLDVSTDGKFVAAGIGSTFHVWQKDGNGIFQPLRQFSSRNNIKDAVIGPDGDWAIVGDENKALTFYGWRNRVFKTQSLHSFNEAVQDVALYKDPGLSPQFAIIGLASGKRHFATIDVDASQNAKSVLSKDVLGGSRLWYMDTPQRGWSFNVVGPGAYEKKFAQLSFQVKIGAGGQPLLSQGNLLNSPDASKGTEWLRFIYNTRTLYTFTNQAMHVWGCGQP